MSSVPDRIDATINRADDLLRERLRREKAALEREDAERADAAREQPSPTHGAAARSPSCTTTRSASFGVSTPSH